MLAYTDLAHLWVKIPLNNANLVPQWMKKSYVSLLISVLKPKEEANHVGNLNVLMVLYANSGIDDLIRCYAIKLIRNVRGYLVVRTIL